MCSVAIFLLSEKEKKLSRLVSAHPSSLDPEDFCCYEPNLYLQGFVVVSECVCVGGWVCVSLCGCGCVTESSSHHKHLSLHSHTTNLSDTQYSRYCQTIESVVVSITYLHTHRVQSLHISHSQWLTSDRAIYLPASYTSVAPAKR